MLNIKYLGVRRLILTLEGVKKRKIKKFYQMIEKDDFLTCEDTLNDLVKIFGELDVEVNNLKVRFLIKKQMWEEAKTLLYEVLSLEKDNTEALYQMGCLYKEVGNLDMAFSYFTRVLHSDKLDSDLISSFNHSHNWIEDYYPQRKNILIILQSIADFDLCRISNLLKSTDILSNTDWNPIIVIMEDESDRQEFYSNKYELIDTEIIKIKRPTELTWSVYDTTVDLYLSLLDETLCEKIQGKIHSFGTNYASIIKELIEINPAIFWSGQVLIEVAKYVNLDTISLIYSSASSGANHFIAYDLKRKLNIPWVMDYSFLTFNYESLNQSNLNLIVMKSIHRNLIQTSDLLICSGKEEERDIKSYIMNDQEKIIIFEKYELEIT